MYHGNMNMSLSNLEYIIDDVIRSQNNPKFSIAIAVNIWATAWLVDQNVTNTHGYLYSMFNSWYHFR